MAAGDGSSVGFGAHMFDGQATGLSVSCLVYYRQYSDMACATEIGSRTDGTPVAASFSLLTEPWAVLFDTNTFDGSAQSILLGMECDIPGDAALTAQPLADNFYFGAGLTTPVDLQYFDIE
ncbi:MAG: hypothetical protein DHS20C11_34870 [Lysobacteraceae bacterium]|nr:MAG: hypothetical protein DHS20C11_34870 [Xanthomonadaceae bacterium]